MDSIIKNLPNIIMNENFSGYILVLIFIIIVGYFKYLKPLLSDFSNIKVVVDSFQPTKQSISIMEKKISEKLEDALKQLNEEQKIISEKIDNEHKKNQVELMNTLSNIDKEIEYLLKRSENIKSKNEQNQRELMIEIVKLQTRLEFMNQNTTVRGLQK